MNQIKISLFLEIIIIFIKSLFLELSHIKFTKEVMSHYNRILSRFTLYYRNAPYSRYQIVFLIFPTFVPDLIFNYRVFQFFIFVDRKLGFSASTKYRIVDTRYKCRKKL